MFFVIRVVRIWRYCSYNGDTSIFLGINQFLKTAALNVSRLPDLQPSEVLSERVHIIAFTSKGTFQIIRNPY